MADGPTKFIRPLQSPSRALNRSRSAIWAAVAPVALWKAAASKPAVAGSALRGAGAADMGEQGGQRAGGHAFDAGGLTQGARAHRDEFLARFRRQAANGAVVE